MWKKSTQQAHSFNLFGWGMTKKNNKIVLAKPDVFLAGLIK